MKSYEEMYALLVKLYAEQEGIVVEYHFEDLPKDKEKKKATKEGTA